MATVSTVLKRQFTFKKNGTTVTLHDPNPEMSIEEVMQFYSGQYPELTTATLEDPEVKGDTATYAVRTTVGTKG
jgi:PRTRC genetic system protein C